MFLAFVSQFIVAGTPHAAAAFGLRGTAFVLNGTLVKRLIAAVAAGLWRSLGERPLMQHSGRWHNLGIGELFVALGLRLALHSDPQ